MMEDVAKAYESLVPRDQILVDAIIIALYEKDAENRKFAKGVVEQLELQQLRSSG